MFTCYLCELLKHKKHTLWEDGFLFATFDTCPVSPGHALLSPKRHIDDFSKLTQSEYVNMKNAIQNILPIIESTNLKNIYESFIKENESEQSIWFCKKALASKNINTKPDGYNHGFNDGKAAGRTVDHFHWHIIPRFRRDMKDSAGGVRFVIPEMGDYLKKRN